MTMTMDDDGAILVHLTNPGGIVGGSGVANQVTYWTDTDTIGGDPGLTYDAATDTITIAGNILMADDKFIGITGDIRIEFDSSDGDIMLHLGDAVGVDEVQIVDSGGGVMAYVNSDGGARFEGHVGIGDHSSLNAITGLFVGEDFTDLAGTIYGIRNITYFNPTANFATSVYALRFLTNVTTAHARTGGEIYGVAGIVTVAPGIAATSLYLTGMMAYTHVADASATRSIGLQIITPYVDTGSCTTGYGIQIVQGTVNQPGGGSITTLYGLYIAAINEGTTNYAIYSAGGDWYMADDLIVGDGSYIGIGAAAERIIFDAAGDISFMGCDVGIGTTSPQTLLHVAGSGSFGDSVTAARATRALNLISTDATLRVWRYTADTALAPAIELAWGNTGDSPGNNGNYWWDIYAYGVDGSFNFRDRSFGQGNARRMVIDSSGYVGIGTTGPLAQLHVDQSSTSGAVPVILLDQADLSEEFIELKTTVGAGNPLDTAAIGSYYGKMRVNVTGVGYKYIALYNS